MDRLKNSLVEYLQRLSGSLRMDLRPDAELLACFTASRSEEAFTALVGRYASLVWENCRRILGATPDAEDAFQATFLALASNASSVHTDRLAGWLHRVSLRISRRSRISQVRRNQREAKYATTTTATEPRPEDDCRFVWEEVENLPERLRMPLVLYYVDGKTQVEAGRILGVSDRAVSQRLDKALATLRARLQRRGIAVSISALGVALSHGTIAAASLPNEFLRRVVASTTAGQVPPAVAALAASGVAPRSSLWIVLMLTVIGGVCGSAATLVWVLQPAQVPSRVDAEARFPASESQARAAEKPSPWVVFTGHVADADGRPVPVAKLAVLGRTWDQRGAGVRDEVIGEGVADAEGSFRLSVERKVPGETTSVWIVASTPHSRTVTTVPVAGGITPTEVAIRLSPGQVTGRVIDPKGRAVTGAVVRVVRFGGASFDFTRPEHKLLPVDFWPAPVTTGPDGRFAVVGVDPSTEVKFTVTHPASWMAAMLNLPAHQMSRQNIDVQMPSVRRFVGRVLAADTGKPLPGAQVTVDFQPDPDGQPWVRAVRSDAKGEFSFALPSAPRWVVEVGSLPLPYLGTRRVVEVLKGDETVTTDVTIERGIAIRGTVVDGDNGLPIRLARVRFFPRSERPASDRHSEGPLAGGSTDADGRFVAAIPPTGGILLATAPSTDYTVVALDPSKTRGRPYAANGVVNVEPGESPEVAFRLEQGHTIRGRALLPDGSPVLNGWVWCSRLVGGRDLQTLYPLTIEDGRFAIPGCQPDQTYTVVFTDRATRHGAVAQLAWSKDHASVTLQPTTPLTRSLPAAELVARLQDELEQARLPR